MKALFSTFFRPFVRKWIFYMVMHFLIFLYLILVGNDQGEFSKKISQALIMLAIGSPMILYFASTEFQQNIKWMINTLYNRKQLIIYHLLVQPLRILLIASPMLFYMLIYPVFRESMNILQEFNLNNSSIIPVVLGLFSTVYVFPFVVIAKKPKTRQNSMIARKQYTKTQKALRVIGAFILIGFVLNMFDAFLPSSIIFVWFINAFLCLLIIKILLRTFRILNETQTNKAIALMFITVSSNTLFEYNIEKENILVGIDAPTRLESFLYLGKIAPKLTKKEFLLFLEVSAHKDRRDFLDLNLENQTNLEIINNYKKINALEAGLDLITSRSQKLEGDEFLSIVDVLEQQSVERKYTAQQIRSLCNVFHSTVLKSSRKNVSYIDLFLNQKSSFRNYIGVELIVHRIPKSEQWQKLKPYVDHLDPIMVKDSFGTDAPPEYLEYLTSLKTD
jgi:hypothetical protein